MWSPVRLVGVAFLLTGVGALATLWPAWRNRSDPGSGSFAVFAVAVAGYALATGLDLFTTNYAVSLALQKVVNACGVLVGAAWLSLAVTVTDRVDDARRLLAALVVVLLAEWTLNWVNPGGVVLARGAGLSGTQFEVVGRVGFWLLLAGAWVQVLAGTGLLVAEFTTAGGLRRRQTGLLALAITPALAASVLNGVVMATADVSYDYTVVGWTLSLALFAVALYSGRFLDVTSVARRRVFEDTADPIVTLDADGRVVDSNPAARELVDADDGWEGTPAATFFDPLPVDGERLWREPDFETELSVDDGSRTRHFTLATTPVAGPQGTDRGHVVSLSEVTVVRERERKLDLMRQVQSRVLRHDIRHDVQIIQPAVEAAMETVDDERRPIVDRASERTEALLSVSEKARAVERLVDREQSPRTLDVATTLRRLVAETSEAFPAVSFGVDAPESCPVEAVPAVELAFENLLENAAEHDDGPDPSVAVTVAERDDAVVVTVTDDGPGIPDHELAVLADGEETPLEHGTGIGLWIVQWVVDSTAAEVTFDADDTGTAVTVTIPRIDET